MRTIFLVSAILCLSKINFAQTNTYWKLGYHCGVNFKTGTCIPNINDTCKMQMGNTNTSVCDNTGNVVFYSNSLFVKNRLDVNMPNGTNFNHGTISNSYITSGYTPTYCGATVVPFPNDTNKYYMFYTNMEYNIKGGFFPDRLRYLVVDKSLNGGLGDITVKDVNVIIDTLMDGQIHSIKHGNGTDYWLLARKYSSNKFYKVLINSSGVSVADTQAIGSPYILGANAGLFCGQSNVSKQGDKLVYLYQAVMLSGTQLDGQMDIIDFDRCTGTITNSNSFTLPVNPPDTVDVLFSCFSPSGRFVYAINYLHCYQFDLNNSANLIANRVKVAHKLPTSWDLGQMQIGIDDKIYCAGGGGAQNMHVIYNPDVLGVGCNFGQNQIYFGGSYSNGGLPNVPNFALGAIAPCGNVGVEQITNTQEQLTIYPNPCGQSLVISNLSLGNTNTIHIYDVLGREVFVMLSVVEASKSIAISVGKLTAGIYFLKATNEKGNTFNTKFVKE